MLRLTRGADHPDDVREERLRPAVLQDHDQHDGAAAARKPEKARDFQRAFGRMGKQSENYTKSDAIGKVCLTVRDGSAGRGD